MWRSPSAFFDAWDYHNEPLGGVEGVSRGAAAATDEVSRRLKTLIGRAQIVYLPNIPGTNFIAGRIWGFTGNDPRAAGEAI